MVNQDKNENISNLGNVTDSIDNTQNTDQRTSIQNEDCYHNNQKHPKVKDFIEYKILGSNNFQKAQIIKRAGKVSCKSKQYSQEEVLINSLVNNFADFDIKNEKLDERNKWKTHKFMIQLIAVMKNL